MMAPTWVRHLVFETSVAYADALLAGRSVQEAEMVRAEVLEREWLRSLTENWG